MYADIKLNITRLTKNTCSIDDDMQPVVPMNYTSLIEYTGKMVHEYGLPQGERSPSFHRADTVRTL